MTIQIGLSAENFNTQYAPLGLLLAVYKEKQVLQPLEKVKTATKVVEFALVDKLEQIFVSIWLGAKRFRK